jgi:hypothetical protein
MKLTTMNFLKTVVLMLGISTVALISVRWKPQLSKPICKGP